MKFGSLRYFFQIFKKESPKIIRTSTEKTFEFKPTAYLSHPFLQSIYNLIENQLHLNFEREKIFFEDGGHVSLDWATTQTQNRNPPILFIMHGLTGGSQMNYIRVLMSEAINEGYQCVCLNSRGINNEMTSPIPFTAISHYQLDAALDIVQNNYPQSPIFMVGTSFGGNYLIRYLLNNRRQNVKGLVALAAPLDVKRVIHEMPLIYQHFFVKRYIYQTVKRHPEMQYWEKIGLVNMKEVLKSKTMPQFHGRITAKILGLQSADDVFDQYNVSGQEIENLNMNTLFMVSKDDPIVSYNSMPLQNIKKNQKIKFHATQKGGHLCWFQGSIPKRWYPRPTLDYLKTLSK